MTPGTSIAQRRRLSMVGLDLGEFPADPALLVLRNLNCTLMSWTNHKPWLWVLHDQTLRVNRAYFKPHRGLRNSDSAAGGSRGRSLGWRGAHSHACR